MASNMMCFKLMPPFDCRRLSPTKAFLCRFRHDDTWVVAANPFGHPRGLSVSSGGITTLSFRYIEGDKRAIKVFPFKSSRRPVMNVPSLHDADQQRQQQQSFSTTVDKITIEDLAVYFHVGVPEDERMTAQKLLITLEMTKDLRSSATSDDLAETIDYADVCQDVKALGKPSRSWKLIETLASDICELVLTKFRPESVRVIVKKFIVPDTRWVSIDISRSRNAE